MSEFHLTAPGSAALPAARTAARAPAGAARIERLQILRAIAACMVVAFHVISNYLPADSIFQAHGLFVLLAGGVDIFFVISGFIIRTTTFRDFGPRGVSAYLKKRFARVVPYYWLITALIVALSLAAPHAFHSYQFEWRHALASFLFIPWPRVDGTIYPPLVPGWSLNFEIMFYLMFAVLMACVRRERATVWMAAIFVVTVAGVRWAGLDPQKFIVGNAFVLEFAVGALFADIWRMRKGQFPRAFGWIGLLLGASMLALALLDDTPGVSSAQIVGFASCFAAFMTLPPPRIPRRLETHLATMGEASYSIYLIHPIVLSPLSVVLARLGALDAHPLVVLALMTSLAVVAGIVAWRLVELPLLGWSRRMLAVGG